MKWVWKLIVSLLVLWMPASVLMAEDGGSSVNYELVIRRVNASQPVVDSSVSVVHPLEVKGDIMDLRDRFQKLGFRHFQLASAVRKPVVMHQREDIDLGDGHRVFYKPIEFQNRKLCLWFDWKDGSGMEVLNTKMHLNPGESVLTGIDEQGGGGVILAIHVAPVVWNGASEGE